MGENSCFVSKITLSCIYFSKRIVLVPFYGYFQHPMAFFHSDGVGFILLAHAI
jgi:hypothetical protein